MIVDGVTNSSGLDAHSDLLVWSLGYLVIEKNIGAWNVSCKRCCDFFAGCVNRQRRYAWAFYTWWSRAEEFRNQRLLERIVCTLEIQTQSSAHHWM